MYELNDCRLTDRPTPLGRVTQRVGRPNDTAIAQLTQIGGQPANPSHANLSGQVTQLARVSRTVYNYVESIAKKASTSTEEEGEEDEDEEEDKL